MPSWSARRLVIVAVGRCSPWPPRAASAAAAVVAAPAEGSPPARPGRPPPCCRGRRHGRAGRGGEGGGHAQRHRAAARLGQLRRDHQGVHGQVRHQGQLGEPRGHQPGRDQRRPAARHPGPRAGRARPRPVVRQQATSPSSRRTRWRRGTRSPPANKDANGAWVNDYGGFISIGCNAKLVADLPDDARRPGQARVRGPGRAQRRPDAGGVRVRRRLGGARWPTAASLRRHRARRRRAGASSPRAATCSRSTPTPATIQSGQTPIVLDWDYLNVTAGREGTRRRSTWKVAVPTDGLFAQYYAQAINKNAPHPAAARLWQEFLYSDEGQNLWLAGQGPPGPAGRDDRRPARPTRRSSRRCRRCTGEPQFPTQARDGRGAAGRRPELGERDGVNPVDDRPARGARPRPADPASAARPVRGAALLGLRAVRARTCWSSSAARCTS